MSNFEVRFENPWLLLLFLPAALIVVGSYVRLPGSQRRSPLHRVSLALRLCTLLLVTLILGGFAFAAGHAGTAMLLLVDRSDSAQRAQADMEADLAEIIELAPGDMRLAVMSFSGGSELVEDFGRPSAPPDFGEAENGAATALADALLAAAARFPSHSLKRIAVLTDGRTTDGDSLSAAAELANKGIRMDALLYDTSLPGGEVEVTSLQLPADTALGQPTRIAVGITGNVETGARLRLYDGDSLLLEKAVSLTPGENAFSFTVSPSLAGLRCYSAEILPEEDTLPQNNRVYQTMLVTSGSAVLIVDGTGEEGEALSQLLSENGYEVHRVASADAPSDITELCTYGLVILMNVDARDLPHFFGEHLEQYVSVYGRSVLSTGGRNTYIYGHMKDTPLETLLPVGMEVEEKESKEPVALMLLLDNSASMEGTAITMAKRGAIKSIESLNDNDYVGVITFSTEYGVLAPLSSVSDKEEIIGAISGLGTVMGTMYGGALEEALDQLSRFRETAQKHVILLSDGNPSDSGYEAYIRQMREAGITLSAIALGSDVSEELMAHLAELGGGEYYAAASSYDLPSIMMTDTILLQVEYTCEGTFTPKRLSGAFYGHALPPVGGYIRAQAKPGASTLLTVGEDHPLYVQWHYGSGMSASLLSDLSGLWSGDWLSSPDGSALILDMVSSLLPGAHTSAALSVSLSAGGARGMLTAHTADAGLQRSYTADIVTPNRQRLTVALSDAGDGVHQREIALDGSGQYAVTLHEYDADRGEIAAYDMAASASWSAEYEAFPSGDAAQEMRETCSVTGGTVVSSAQELLSVYTDDMVAQYDPTHGLAVFAFALMLLDILIRRLRPRLPVRPLPPHRRRQSL
ncbi:MAG: VWA domain-containing protein [Clostridia bacterium]|nr:VWA domain-containing protein [Clostridia bacterium]